MVALVSCYANAAVNVVSDNDKQIVLSVSEQYALGDNDSMTEAKQLVLEQAKKSASDYAGSYVESELKVNGQTITKQEIRVLTAGFMEVLEHKEAKSLGENGGLLLTTTAKIRLSKESITDGLNKLKTDPERKQKIAALEKENTRLQGELYELTKKINSGTTRADLIKRREEILANLDQNRTTAKKVFEKGTLFQLAQLDADEYELAVKDINDNLFGMLKNKLHVDLGDPKFIRDKSGNGYNVLVPVNWWGLTPLEVSNALSKHFYLKKYRSNQNPEGYVGFDYYDNDDQKGKAYYSKKLVEYVKGKIVAIKVTAGDKIGYLPIAGESTESFTHEYVFKIRGGFAVQGINKYVHKNPVNILNLSEKELKSISEIKADVVVLDSKSLRSWKYYER